MPFAVLDEFRRDHARAIERLYARSTPERWSLTVGEFAAALHRSVAARFAFDGRATAEDVERYLDSLFVEDLALACACERGEHAAWLALLDRFRPGVLEAARALARDEVRAQELANNLYADLYGLEEKSGERRSLFAYFHGRSSLGTWMRSVMTRSFVNEHRVAKRAETLKTRLQGEAQAANPSAAEPLDPGRARLVERLGAAFDEALGRLPARDRLRLSYYYVQELTLAQIGRLLGEHESTVSRKLAQIRRALRKDVEKAMGVGFGLSPADVRDCYEAAIDGGIVDFARSLDEEAG